MSPQPASVSLRSVPFFGRRVGRPLRPTRRRLLEERLPKLAIALPEEGRLVDPRALFAFEAQAIWLEIGCGSGEHLLGRMAAHAEAAFVGCEPYINGLASLLTALDEAHLHRIRIYADDARPLLQQLVSASIDHVLVLFSDPWPKRRHHPRRFIQAATLEHIGRVLRPGGELLFATDDLNYARWTLELATAQPSLAWLARRPQDWRMPPIGWVATRYQRKAQANGRTCVYLRFCRRRDP